MTATATDAAGNVSPVGAAFSLTIDATPPAPPAAPGLLAADDSGTAGDGLTNVAKPRLTGTAEAGATVGLLDRRRLVGRLGDGDRGLVHDRPDLGPGRRDVCPHRDRDRRSGKCRRRERPVLADDRHDRARPAPAAAGLLAADDSGAVGDGITNVVRPAPRPARPSRGRPSGSFIAGNVVGTGTATGGGVLDPADVGPGRRHVFRHRDRDRRRRQHERGEPPLLADDRHGRTVGPGRPDAPGGRRLRRGGRRDHERDEPPPHRDGRGGHHGQSLRRQQAPRHGRRDRRRLYTIVLTSALADGTYSVTATATDAAGNVSASGPAFSLTIDTTAPSPPRPPRRLLAADDSGAVGDGITNVGQPRLTGAAEAGSTVTLLIGGNAVGAGVATGGTYTIPIGSTLADGTYSVTARDRRRRERQRRGRLLRADDRHDGPRRPAGAGAPGGRRLGDARRRRHDRREAPPDRLGRVGRDGPALRSPATLVGSGTATGGTFTIAIAPALADGTYSVTATATDAAGNASAAAAPFRAWTIDTDRPPPAPAAAGLLGGRRLGDRPATGSPTSARRGSPARREPARPSSSTVAGQGRRHGPGDGRDVHDRDRLSPGRWDVFRHRHRDRPRGQRGPRRPGVPPDDRHVRPVRPRPGPCRGGRLGRQGRRRHRRPRPSRHRHGPARDDGPVARRGRERRGQRPGRGRRVVHARDAQQARRDVRLPRPRPRFGRQPRRGEPAALVPHPRRRGRLRRRRQSRPDDLQRRRPTSGRSSSRAPARPSRSPVRPASRARRSPIAADFDGDGKTDPAVYVPSTGGWFIYNSATKTVTHYAFGAPGDIPVPGDYTGIGRAEPAVYRPSTSQWIVFNPVNAAGYVWTFGFANASLPVPAPYAGYGTADLAIYQPSTGDWYSVNTTTWALSHTTFGGPGFTPVPADYDGDGRADIAVYWSSKAQWIVQQSSTTTARRLHLRRAPTSTSPVPLDYDGDGEADLAIYLAGGLGLRAPSSRTRTGSGSGRHEDGRSSSGDDAGRRSPRLVLRAAVATALQNRERIGGLGPARRS